MKAALTTKSGFEFLQSIDAQHPWSLVTETSDDSTVRLKILIDGGASSHTVYLDDDGTWSVVTEVAP
jgi:hypothetical protein